MVAMNFLIWCLTVISLCCAVTQKCSIKEGMDNYFCVCDTMDRVDGWSYNCLDSITFEPAFTVKYVSGQSVTFQCGTDELHYNSVLHQLDLESIQTYLFQSCPLPSESYDQILLPDHPVKYIRIERIKGKANFTSDTFGNISKTLETLILQANGIENISEYLFNNFTNLKYLSLSDNKLKALPENLFQNLSNLNTLEITNNLLESLAEDAFKNQVLLEKLFLYKNKLRKLPEAVFRNLVNLKILDLSDNQLILLPNSVFSSLSNIISIRLRGNWFGTIPEDIFRNCSALKVIDLSVNRFMEPLPESIFYELNLLENVSINDCNLTLIHEDTFSHNILMMYLNMERNKIVHLPEQLFRNNSKLEELNINFNFLHNFPSFPTQTNLKKLSLFRNNLTSVPDKIFQKARNIRNLILGQNKIQNITNSTFRHLPDLEILDLSVNNLTYFGLTSNLKIKKLDLSYNRLTKMPEIRWSQYVKLENLNLEHNSIEFVEIPWLLNLNNPIINIANNQIKTVSINKVIGYDLDIKSEETSNNYNKFYETRVILESNPFRCDCYLFGFYEYIKQGTGRPRSIHFDNADSLSCFEPSGYANKTIISLNPDQFTCDLTDNCSLPCHCYFRTYDAANVVNCSNQGLKSLPERIPRNSSVLHFQNNMLTKMESLNEEHWQNLIELYLDHNQINTIDNWTVPMTLRNLSLRGNHIRRLPKFLMDFIAKSKHSYLLLSGNPWTCNCSTMTFKEWLTEHYKIIGDVQKVMCGNRLKWNHTFIRNSILTTPDVVLCPLDVWPQKVHLITVSAICVLLFVLLFVVIVLYYRNKQTVIAYVYIHMHHVFTCFFSEEDMDEDKIFDAFVSYSSSDRDVAMSLIEELENKEPRFNLCIHERNWIAGNQISWNIFNSVHNSKRTILVISKAFLESMWFQVEFHTAYYQMLEDKIDRLIIIVKGDLPPKENLDRDLQYLLSTKTYLIWEEKWFWEKLKYAMPHKKQLLPSTVLALKDRPDNEKIKPVDNQIAILSASSVQLVK